MVGSLVYIENKSIGSQNYFDDINYWVIGLIFRFNLQLLLIFIFLYDVGKVANFCCLMLSDFFDVGMFFYIVVVCFLHCNQLPFRYIFLTVQLLRSVWVVKSAILLQRRVLLVNTA